MLSIYEPRVTFAQQASPHHDGLYQHHIIVKFIDSVPVRLLKIKKLDKKARDTLKALSLRDTTVDKSQLTAIGVNKDVVLREMADINHLLTNTDIVRFDSLFTRPVYVLERERRHAQEASGEQMADLSNYCPSAIFRAQNLEIFPIFPSFAPCI